MIAALAAPAHWRCIEFISDLHLQAAMPETFKAWRNYLHTTRADALFILGDLFEVWIGDDLLAGDGATQASGFESECVALLREVASRIPVYVMHGNRDFLLGADFAQASGTQLLADPCRLEAGGQSWLLSHGDALCLADTAYMAFRTEVRSAVWQRNFLAQPLAARMAIARALREQSEQRKHSGMDLADVDSGQAMQWLAESGARTLVHGHTHRAADHCISETLRRVVLSDWDADANAPRAEVLQLMLPQEGAATAILLRRSLLSPA